MSSSRVLLRLGLALLLVAAGAGAWEVLASQAPGSPLYLGVLPGPIQALRETAFTWGVLVLLAGLLAPRALASGEPPKWLLAALAVGVCCTVGAALYGALHGMYGAQLFDPRPDAPLLFTFRCVGIVTSTLCLAALARRALRA